MPIIFYSRNDTFIKAMKDNGYEAHKSDIRNYKSNKKTFYVSPANSLGYMDGGMDCVLTEIMPGIDIKLREKINKLDCKTAYDKPYLPIGSSMIVKHKHNIYLISAPTMLIPQNVSQTNNAYYATQAILYNILVSNKYDIDKVNIIFTSLCCGYGGMTIEKSTEQIILGIKHYKDYDCKIFDKNTIINEPNLMEQEQLFDNEDWFIKKIT